MFANPSSSLPRLSGTHGPPRGPVSMAPETLTPMPPRPTTSSSSNLPLHNSRWQQMGARQQQLVLDPVYSSPTLQRRPQTVANDGGRGCPRSSGGDGFVPLGFAPPPGSSGGGSEAWGSSLIDAASAYAGASDAALDDAPETARLRCELMQMQQALHHAQAALVGSYRAGNKFVGGAQFRTTAGPAAGHVPTKCTECASLKTLLKRTKVDEERAREEGLTMRSRLDEAESAARTLKQSLVEVRQQLAAAETRAAAATARASKELPTLHTPALNTALPPPTARPLDGDRPGVSDLASVHALREELAVSRAETAASEAECERLRRLLESEQAERRAERRAAPPLGSALAPAPAAAPASVAASSAAADAAAEASRRLALMEQEHQRAVAKLESEARDLRAEALRTRQQLEQHTKQAAKVAKEKEELLGERAVASAKLREMLLSASRAESSASKREGAAHSALRSTMAGALCDLETEAEGLRRHLGRLQKLADAANAKAQAAAAERSAAAAQLAESRQAAEAARAEAAAAKAEAEVVRAEAAASASRAADLAEQLPLLAKQLEALQAGAEQGRTALVSLEALEAELERLRRLVKELEDRLKADAAGAAAELAAVVDAAAVLGAKHAAAEAEAAAVRAAVRDAEERASAAMRAQSEAVTMAAAATSHAAQIQEHTVKLEELARQLQAALADEKASSAAAGGAFSAEIRNLDTQLATLLAAQKHAQSESAALAEAQRLHAQQQAALIKKELEARALAQAAAAQSELQAKQLREEQTSRNLWQRAAAAEKEQQQQRTAVLAAEVDRLKALRDQEMTSLRAVAQAAQAEARAKEKEVEMAVVASRAKEHEVKELRSNMEDLMQSSVRLCVVAPTVNVTFGGQIHAHKAPMPKERIRQTLEKEVLPTFTRCFTQPHEAKAPDGGSMDEWLKGVTNSMQASIEMHLSKVFQQ